MVTFTWVNGSMTKRMEKESTITKTEPSTKVNGSATDNTVTDVKPGQTKHASKESTFRVRSMAMVSSIGMTAPPMKATLATMKSAVKVCIRGAMDVAITATGKKTRCTARVPLNTSTEKYSKAAMSMIEKMDLAF